MILPSKHLPIKRSLIGCGAHVVSKLKRPRTIDSIWKDLRSEKKIESFAKLVATIEVLFMLGFVEMRDNKLRVLPRPRPEID